MLNFVLESLLITAVTKISSCWLNTRSRLGIKQLLIYFGSMFPYFSVKVAGIMFKLGGAGGGGNPGSLALNDSPYTHKLLST